jgi:DNA-binding transcriptional LysR family regulator
MEIQSGKKFHSYRVGVMVYSFKDLSVFLRAAQSQSFVEAANALGMTPSAVGKIIQKIEDRHNIRLFKRSTRNIFLTDEGEILLHHAAKILGEFEEITTSFNEIKSGYVGKLKVSIPNIENIFSEMLSEFINMHPQINLEVHLNDDYSDIIKDGYDAVIRFGEISDSRLFTKRIGTLSMGVFHSSDYIPASDITENFFLFYRYPYSGKIEHWGEALQYDINKVRYQKTFNSISMIKQLCKAGAGMAYLPETICRQELMEGSMVRFSDSQVTSRNVNIVWPNNRNSGIKLRAFIDFFIKAFQR